jgi:hypothetical protein
MSPEHLQGEPLDASGRSIAAARCPATTHRRTSWRRRTYPALTWALSERSEPVTFLIRDNDRKVTEDFDAVFEAHGSRLFWAGISGLDAGD